MSTATILSLLIKRAADDKESEATKAKATEAKDSADQKAKKYQPAPELSYRDQRAKEHATAGLDSTRANQLASSDAQQLEAAYRKAGKPPSESQLSKVRTTADTRIPEPDKQTGVRINRFTGKPIGVQTVEGDAPSPFGPAGGKSPASLERKTQRQKDSDSTPGGPSLQEGWARDRRNEEGAKAEAERISKVPAGTMGPSAKERAETTAPPEARTKGEAEQKADKWLEDRTAPKAAPATAKPEAAPKTAPKESPGAQAAIDVFGEVEREQAAANAARLANIVGDAPAKPAPAAAPSVVEKVLGSAPAQQPGIPPAPPQLPWPTEAEDTLPSSVVSPPTGTAPTSPSVQQPSLARQMTAPAQLPWPTEAEDALPPVAPPAVASAPPAPPVAKTPAMPTWANSQGANWKAAPSASMPIADASWTAPSPANKSPTAIPGAAVAKAPGAAPGGGPGAPMSMGGGHNFSFNSPPNGSVSPPAGQSTAPAAPPKPPNI